MVTLTREDSHFDRSTVTEPTKRTTRFYSEIKALAEEIKNIVTRVTILPTPSVTDEEFEPEKVCIWISSRDS